jgi:6-phosphogluconolactonase (cycloisomerase 2 family)
LVSLNKRYFFVRIQSLFISLCVSLALLVLAGCGGVATAGSSPTPTPSPAGTFSPSRFIYGIIAFEADGIYAGQIDSGTGRVSPLAGNPFANAMGQNIVIQVPVDPKGRFVYMLNLGASSFGNVLGRPGIGEYQIDPLSGALKPVPNGTVVFPSTRSGRLAVDGLGRFLYEPNGSSFDLWSIDQGSGLLNQMAGTTLAPVGFFIVASNDGRFLFNGGNQVVFGTLGNGMVEAASINQSTGQLVSNGPALPTGGSAGPMVVSRDGKSLYVANTTEGTIAVFNVSSSGALTPAIGSPFTSNAIAVGLTLTPDGKYLYVVSSISSIASTVQGYAVNPATGVFTAIPGAVVDATTVAVDGSGKFAYITELTATTTQLSTYIIDPATGALTRASQAAQPISFDSGDVAVAQ